MLSALSVVKTFHKIYSEMVYFPLGLDHLGFNCDVICIFMIVLSLMFIHIDFMLLFIIPDKDKTIHLMCLKSNKQLVVQ